MNENITHTVATEEDMHAFAARLAKAIHHGAVIYLEGELGAGKTTFTRGFLRALGFAGKVKSPTYTLVEPYEINHQHIFHFDLYRLKQADELKFIGIDEYFTRDAICLIEWPTKGYPLLPAPDLTCYILIAGHVRDVRLEANTARGQEILSSL